MKETTLKEIAETLGISITTVSKALKNYSDVSEKTRKAVIALAEELNYTPNSFAVNLRTKESKTIGLIIPEVMHHFFSNVINAIIDEAEKNGYLVIILQSNETLELEKKQVELLINKRVDGIIMSLSNESNNDEHIKGIINRKIPFVMFDKIAKLTTCSKVIIDDQKAALNATQHLIDNGCKKIAHFRGPLNPQNSIDRFLGYKKALEDNNIAYDPSLVYLCENNLDFDDGYWNAKKIAIEHPEIDAIFAVTDLVAIGIIKYFNEIGIEIPRQVAVFGFSNWFMSSIISPKLTTINQPGFEIGQRAASILFDEIKAKKNDETVVFQSIELNTSIIEREST